MKALLRGTENVASSIEEAKIPANIKATNQLVVVSAKRRDMPGVIENIHFKMLETGNLEDQVNQRPLASIVASPTRRSTKQRT